MLWDDYASDSVTAVSGVSGARCGRGGGWEPTERAGGGPGGGPRSRAPAVTTDMEIKQGRIGMEMGGVGAEWERRLWDWAAGWAAAGRLSSQPGTARHRLSRHQFHTAVQ